MLEKPFQLVLRVQAVVGIIHESLVLPYVFLSGSFVQYGEIRVACSDLLMLCICEFVDIGDAVAVQPVRYYHLAL